MECGEKPKGAKPEPWYAVWTRSHCEQLVAQQLATKGFDAFLPEMQAWSRRAGVPHLIRVPMFPGYLFVSSRMDRQRHVAVLGVRGVVRVLGEDGHRPTPIPDTQVAAIRRIVESEVAVLPHDHLSKGDRVRVVDGPLSGVEGIYLQDRAARGRLVLSIDLLGRSVALEVDRHADIPC
jgi:transcription termination/antitermination protein NusG